LSCGGLGPGKEISMGCQACLSIGTVHRSGLKKVHMHRYQQQRNVVSFSPVPYHTYLGNRLDVCSNQSPRSMEPKSSASAVRHPFPGFEPSHLPIQESSTSQWTLHSTPDQPTQTLETHSTSQAPTRPNCSNIRRILYNLEEKTPHHRAGHGGSQPKDSNSPLPPNPILPTPNLQPRTHRRLRIHRTKLLPVKHQTRFLH
jgi:hypothetical protein